MSKIIETLTIPFIDDTSDLESVRRNRDYQEKAECLIVFEQMSSDLAEGGSADGSEAVIKEDTLFFKCFPTKNITIMASFGSASITEESRTDTIIDVIAFGGTSSSLLHYPEAYEVIVTPLGNVIQEVIAQYDSSTYKKGDVMELRIITPTFVFNRETNSIDSLNSGTLTEIYGHCKVEYKSNYAIVKYVPDFSKLTSRTRNDKKKKGKSDKLYAGTIYAYRLFKGKTYAVSHDVELDKVKTPEYARVYSKIVLDEDGAHEAPEGWPTTTELDGVSFNKNNGKTPKPELDPDQSFTDHRTHLLITIDMFGNLSWDHQNHWLLDPYDVPRISCEEKKDNPKKPEFFLKFASPPGGAKTNSAEEFIFEMMTTTWRDIFIIPNKEKVKEKILDYFGPMKGIEE